MYINILAKKSNIQISFSFIQRAYLTSSTFWQRAASGAIMWPRALTNVLVINATE